ncbi:MAG: hypothetical protein M1546_02890 [Chloroflexi bacterium]|nr:hypothetical protein [Chloroflexota bacterium]
MNELLNPLSNIVNVLEVVMLGTALYLTITDSVSIVISAYRLQSFLLAIVAGTTAIIRAANGDAGVVRLIILVVILPILLVILIRMLLVRATVSSSSLRLSFRVTAEDSMQAERIWRERATTPQPRPRDILAILALALLAFLIAAFVLPPEGEVKDLLLERVGLGVSLTLHLVGLYNMVLKRDIISQVIGLLLMDQGLYLAVVKIVAIPVPAEFFVISLYFYTLITMFILIFLLPKVRQVTNTIDSARIADESTLEG